MKSVATLICHLDLSNEYFEYIFHIHLLAVTGVMHEADNARRAEECPKSCHITFADISITACLYKFKTTKCIKL